MKKALIVFPIMCIYFLTPMARGAVLSHDISDNPLFATTDVPWGSAWEVEKEYLSVETIPGQSWSTVLFEVHGSKHNYSSPYGTPGTLYHGWISTRNTDTVVDPDSEEWRRSVIRFSGGETIDHTRSYDSADIDGELISLARRVEDHRPWQWPARRINTHSSTGGFVDTTLPPSPVSGYLGFSVQSPWDEIHYGWMQVETFISDTTVDLKVLGWGIEEVGGRAVTVGHQGPLRKGIDFNEHVNVLIDDSQLAILSEGKLMIEANPGFSALLKSVTMLDEESEEYAFLNSLGNVEFIVDFDLSLEPGESVRLLFDIGEGIADDIEVWYFNGLNKEKLGADQWLYRGAHLIIPEANQFSSYGIVVIPEPSTLALFGIAGFYLMKRRRM